MFEELVNNDNYLVKQGFRPWEVLKAPIELTSFAQEIRIKLNCGHANYYNENGIDWCPDCQASLRVTSFRD